MRSSGSGFRALGVALFASQLAALAALAVAACGTDDEPTPATPTEAGLEASLVGDASPPDAGGEVPLGEICGDARGLEPNAPWPLRGGCPKRAGLAASLGPQNATLAWTVALPAGESSVAIAADRLLWVGTTSGHVLAMSSSGVVQWALATGGPVRSSPARSASGITIVGGGDGALYGVDRGGGGGADAGDDGGDAGDDGGDAGPSFRPAKQVFRRALAPLASSPALGSDGTIYVTTTDGKLLALAADGSAVKWTATTNDTLGSSPALALDGTIYVGSSDRRLYAFTPDGATKWSVDTGAAILGSPVVGGDEVVYVGSSDGQLRAVEPGGTVRWSYAAGGPITGAPAVRGGVVYVGSDDKKLHAVSTIDGKRKWTYETLGEVATPAIATDGTVYVGSTDGRLYAVTPTGLLFWAVNVRGKIRSAPAMGDDGRIYVTSDTGVHAIGP